VSPLVEEVRLGYCRKPGKEDYLHAVRAIRVLRHIGTPKAIGVCRYLLLGKRADSFTREQSALLTEAVAYLSENFSRKEARDMYALFVRQHNDKYMGKKYLKEHWQAGWNADVFRVDVAYGVPFLVKEDDPRVKEVLALLLKTVTSSAYGGSAVWRLSDDGFSVMADPINSMGRNVWPESLMNALMRERTE